MPDDLPPIPDRVAAGAAFMDEHDPGWWRPGIERAIDLDTLDLGDEASCVLGQRCPLEVLADYAEREWGRAEDADDFDRYSAYAEALSGIRSPLALWEWAHGHGFSCPPGVAGRWHGWAELTAEWNRVITERRAAVKAGA